MKLNFPCKILYLICLVIPLAFHPQTFDQFGTVKMGIFLFLAFLIFIALIFQYQRLNALPKHLIIAFTFFISVQLFQTLRLPNIGLGFWGAYGQSESLIVQLAFVVTCLGSYLFIENESNRDKIWSIILVTVCFTSIYSIFQYFYQDPIVKTNLARVTSLFGDPNSFGIFLVLTLPIVILKFKNLFANKYSYYVAAGFFVGVIALFLTFSRTAWLAFLFSLFIITCVTIGKVIKDKASAKSELLFISLIILISVFGIITGEVFTRIKPGNHQDYTLNARVSSVVSHPNDSGRGLLWPIAWKTFLQSPLVGYGIGSFQKNFHLWETPAAIQHWGPTRDLFQVHNEILHYLATQGILGLISYLGLLLAIFGAINPLQLLKASLTFEKTVLSCAVIGYLICMQFAYPLVHYSFLFWLFLGILLRMHIPAAAEVPIKIKPFVKILITGLILIWGYVLVIFFRADIFYHNAWYQKHYNYSKSLNSFQTILSLTPWVYHYRYEYALTLFRVANSKNIQYSNPESKKIYLNQARNNLLILLKTNPDRYELKFLLGQIAEQKNDLAKAADYYRQALRLHPNQFQICFRLAKVELMLGNKNAYLKEFNAGLKINASYMLKMKKQEGIKFP